MYNTECLVFLTKIEFCDPCDTYAPAECYLPSIITKAKCHFQILELIISITIFLCYEYEIHRISGCITIQNDILIGKNFEEMI